MAIGVPAHYEKIIFFQPKGMLSFSLFFKNRKYFAPAFLFSCFSLFFSTWVVYIPFIGDKLGISEGKLGGALFFTAMGSLTMTPVSNWLVNRTGVGKMSFYGFIAYGISLYGMFLAPDYAWLCLALFLFGMMASVFSISVNSLIALIERQANRYIITGSHGFWSMGGILGAATGSFVAAWFGRPLLHITVIFLILLLIQFRLKNEYVHLSIDNTVKQAKRRFSIRPLLAMAAIGLAVMVSEGAIADWSGLYLKKITLMKPQFLGLGYAFFASGMTLGRFSGDSLSGRMGSWKLLRLALATSLGGLILILTAYPVLTMLGFFVVGLGFSVVVPEVFRMAASIRSIRTSDGVSFLAATANIGFLTGPVVLGLIAEWKNLRISFLALTVLVAFTLLLAWHRSVKLTYTQSS